MPRTRKSMFKSLLFGLLIAVIYTFTAMLVLAAALLFFRFSDGVLRIINQLIKISAIVLGACFAIPQGAERGLASGLEMALIYSVAGYASYVALGGHDFGFSAFLGELLLGAASGAVTGVIRANMRPKKRRFSTPVRC